MLKLILGALNIQQVITFIFSTAAAVIISKLVSDPELQKVLIVASSNIGALLVVLLRKPSAEGGSAVSK
jgi:hypothetical protein